MSAAASTSKDGEEVFSESRSLLFKSLKVKRLVDKEGESIVYAVFSQRLDKNEDANNSRFKSALCAVRSPHRTRVLPPRHRSAPTACALRRRCTWTSLRRLRRSEGSWNARQRARRNPHLKSHNHVDREYL